jgi:acyl dehydratase
MTELQPPSSGYRVTARNTATESTNRIHDDATARDYGFKGGLVPGSVVYEHVCHPLVEAYGTDWLGNGWIRLRLLNPVYDGEVITIQTAAAPEGPEIELRAVNEMGLLCAQARAGFTGPGAERVSCDSYLEAPLPERAPPASEEAFRNLEVMGTVDARLDPEAARAYLAEIGEHMPIYEREGLIPPGHHLSSANHLLSANLRLGPWIHASSEVRHLSPARQGEPLRMRGRVAALHQRRGHRFVELDALMIGSGRRAVAEVRHTAIYEPARRPS